MKLLEHNGGVWTREEFIYYLEKRLIPDLKEVEMEATAADFELAVRFIRNEDQKNEYGLTDPDEIYEERLKRIY